MNGFSKGLLGRKPTTLADLMVGQSGPAVRGFAPEQSAAKEEQKLWLQGSETPVPPPSYLFPVEAFDRAGRSLWKDEWVGREMRVAELPLRPLPELPASAFPDGFMVKQDADMNRISYWMAKQIIEMLPDFDLDLPSLTVSMDIREEDYNRIRTEYDRLRDRWIACRVRWKDTVEKLCQRFAVGSIGTVYRIKGGGRPEAISPDWWQIDSYFARLRSCGLNPAHPFDPTAERTAWFFVHEEDLAREFGSSIGADDPSPAHALLSKDVHLSPYIRLMMDVAHLVGIGPQPEQQIQKEALIADIMNEANRKHLDITPKEADMMATFIREPFAKKGLRKVLADQRAKSATTNT